MCVNYFIFTPLVLKGFLSWGYGDGCVADTNYWTDKQFISHVCSHVFSGEGNTAPCRASWGCTQKTGKNQRLREVDSRVSKWAGWNLKCMTQV